MAIHRPLLIFGLAALLLFAGAQIWMGVQSNAPRIQERPQGAPFVLQSASGDFDLASLDDRLALIYFGYTWCPDICPASMMFMAGAIQQLPEDWQHLIQPIFISVDPERDTPERLAAYADFFEADILGLTGEATQLEALARSYGAFYRFVELDSAMGYAVDHSSDFYLASSQGELLATLPHANSSDELYRALTAALARLANDTENDTEEGT